MKHSLLLPLRFLLRIVLYCLIGSVFLIAYYASRFSADMPSIQFFVSRVFFHGGEIFFTSFLLSLILSLFSITRRPGIKTLTFFLLFGTAVVTLFTGMLGLDGLKGLGTLPEPVLPFEANLLFITEDGAFWIGDLEGPIIKTILTQSDKKGGTRFRVYPEGIYKNDTETIRLFPGGEEFTAVNVLSVTAPEFLDTFFKNIVFTAKNSVPGSATDLRSLLFCAALVFFCVSLWTLVRLTRWPLFNVWITFAALWIMLGALRFWGEIFLPEVLMLTRGGPLISHVPVLLLCLCGVILFLACLLMRPLHEWMRDVDYD